ncbi:hypothetical protein AAFF_G00209280 [Aldrovandia affinis]|uniref:Uncharacterized protein n=1 Tax=Aldrovandia affinis TaxID=143900 RepID=A0AAD7WUN2_9TELE|nr:hypothetical protein AAFF_G00209280 [Aldrovandia affinis]
MERAFEKLPSNLGYLLSEVPKWFSKSTLRREAFNNLFQVMDANNDRRGTPKPFQKMSTTRWLVRGKVIYSLLVNWHELKAFFCSTPHGRRILPEGENDRINLKVAGQDGSVVQFKIKRHTPLNKLMKAYCERQRPGWARFNSDYHATRGLLHLWRQPVQYGRRVEQIQMDTDASNNGLGALLSQEIPEEKRVVAYYSRAFIRNELGHGSLSSDAAMSRMSLILLVSAVCLHGIVAAEEHCKDYGTQFERVFTIPGDAAALKCQLEVSDIHNATYNISWYERKTGRELSGEVGRIRVRETILWFLNSTLEDAGSYECLLRTPNSCFKQATVLRVDQTKEGHCGRPYAATQVLTVITNSFLVCPLLIYMNHVDSYSIQWYKECEPILEGDKFAYVGKNKLLIRHVDLNDTGHYTCRMTFNLTGTIGYTAETIKSHIKEEWNLRPAVSEPVNETIKTDLGGHFNKTCRVFVPSKGNLAVDVYWATVDFISTDRSDRVHQVHLSKKEVPNGEWLEVLINFTEVMEEDLNQTYTCLVYSDKGVVTSAFILQPSDPNFILPLLLLFMGLALMFLTSVAAYKIFKIDIVLWCRRSFSYLYTSAESDGKIYDAYVVYPRLCLGGSCGSGETFAFHTLPQVLEKKCGYKLFIVGRDSLPGEAVVDSVQENISKSRRLILLYTDSTFSKLASTLGFEQEIGLHIALMESTLQVILGNGQQEALETYHATVGQFLQLECQINSSFMGTESNSNLIWSRDNNQGLDATTSRVRMRNGTLLFLPVKYSDSGHYTCKGSIPNPVSPTNRGPLEHKETKMFLLVEGTDGKLYDAYVSFLHWGALCSSRAKEFFFQVLPEVLEQRHGYRLFINGRDDLPGESANGVIADTVRNSRRIVIILSAQSQANQEQESLVLWDRNQDRPDLDQLTILCDTLIHSEIQVILLETDKDIDYSLVPESLRHVRQKHGALRWRPSSSDPTTPPNGRFWKCLRYRMPPEAQSDHT